MPNVIHASKLFKEISHLLLVEPVGHVADVDHAAVLLVLVRGDLGDLTIFGWSCYKTEKLTLVRTLHFLFLPSEISRPFSVAWRQSLHLEE